MSRFFNLGLTSACASLLLVAPDSHAALISINTSPLSANGAEIGGGPTTTQTYAAWNVNDDQTPNAMVNGVEFEQTQPSTIAVSNPGGGGQSSWTQNIDEYSTAAMDQIMDSYLVSALGGTFTITVSGLTIGEQYRIQVMHHQDLDAGGGNNRQFRAYFGSNASGSNGGLVDVSGDQGFITTADFTADAASQSLFLAPNDSGDRSVVNGIAVFETSSAVVPEPASIALLGIGSLCVASRRRRG